MNKILIFSSILLLILIVVFIFAISGNLEKSDWDKKWTTAICEDNECQDFLVTCSGQNVVEMSAISGKVVFPDSWVDKREDKELC